MITNDQLVSFILRYRSGKVFRKFTLAEIVECVNSAIDNGLMIVDASVSGSVHGLLVFSLDLEARSLHVEHALTIKKDALLRIINRACEVYGVENFDTITFERRDKMKTYKLNNLLRNIYGRL